MLTKIGVKNQDITASVKLLSQLLADEFVLYVKTQNAHWNVEGSDFYNKHLFFEVQYKELAEIIDTVAERIRGIGHYAPASLSTFLGLTNLTEEIKQDNDSFSFIETLLEDHIVIINQLRNNLTSEGPYTDAGTNDFMVMLIGKHEQMAWKLRSHLP